MFHARRWLLSVGLGYAEIAVGAVIFIVMTPLLVSRLGAEAYAVWVLGHAIAAYLRMFDLGLDVEQTDRGGVAAVCQQLALAVATRSPG